MTRDEFERATLEECCEQLMEEDYGDITSLETLKSFAKDLIDSDDYNVASHICEALWDNTTDYYIYDYCMGTLDTPTPITSKDDIRHLIDD